MQIKHVNIKYISSYLRMEMNLLLSNHSHHKIQENQMHLENLRKKND